jgi:ribosomal protein L40E
MSNALPLFFVIAAGLCLSFVLFWLWQSFRGLMLLRDTSVGTSAHRDLGRERLLHEKQELLTAIRDVRLEHELGKVSDADFARLEQHYRSRAREVLRELEEQLAPHRPRAQLLLEQALGKPVPASAPVVVASEATLVSPCLCSQCGISNESDAVFCKKCGARLRPEVTG